MDSVSCRPATTRYSSAAGLPATRRAGRPRSASAARWLSNDDVMKRREFLTKSSLLVGGLPFVPGLKAVCAQPTSSAARSEAQQAPAQISFETSDPRYQATYAHALEVLARNTTTVSGYALPVLIEGSNYSGIWLECAPQEGLAYSLIRPDVARNNHLAFFALQREDGQIPCWSRTTAIGFGQIQMVVPIAATAWELSQATGDSELLEKAYARAAAGMPGYAAIAIPGTQACAKGSAPRTPVTTTAHAGRDAESVSRCGRAQVSAGGILAACVS